MSESHRLDYMQFKKDKKKGTTTIEFSGRSTKGALLKDDGTPLEFVMPKVLGPEYSTRLAKCIARINNLAINVLRNGENGKDIVVAFSNINS